MRRAATPRPRNWGTVVMYVGNALVACVILTVVLQLWRMNWHIPLYFSGDAVFTGSSIKAMIENGWFWFNPHVGAPGVSNMLDYPAADTFHWVVLKAISLVAGDWAATLNAFYLLGFPVTSVVALWAFRRLGLTTPTAFAMSLLYAFLPYHTLRAEAHLFLGAYYAIPLVLVVCIELFGDAPPMVSAGSADRPRIDFKSKSSWLVLTLCVVIGSSGVYYAVFTCFFLAIAALIGWWRSGERVRLVVAAVLVGVIGLTVAVNLAPYVWYRMQAGPNTAGVERGIAGGEIYSLRPAQLVLPVSNHRIGVLAYVNQGYTHVLDSIAPVLVNESSTAALGIIGAVGLMFLLLVLLLGLRPNAPPASDALRIGGVASLAGAAILLASSGGFGTILAVVLPQIRAYNRISVFVAFLALFGAGVLLDRLTGRVGARSRQWAVPIVIVLVVAVGTLDQTTAEMVPHYDTTAVTWATNEAFISSIEAGLPDGAKVLQLPYVQFPESPGIEKMYDYDHFRPYMQSSKIHWSYGAVKGRPDAQFNESVAALPAAQLVDKAKGAGFAGVWVDTSGYADRGKALGADLSAATGSSARRSGDGRYLFYAIQ